MPETIACNISDLPNENLEEVLERLPTFGIDAVELPLLANSSLEELLQSKNRIEKCRLRVSSCDLGTWQSPEIEFLDRMRHGLQFVSEMDLSVVVGSTGFSAANGQRDRTIAALQAIGAEAEKLRIVYCVEMERGISQNHAQMLELLRDVDRSNIRASFNTGDVLAFNKNIVGEISLAKVCHMVGHLQLADWAGEDAEISFPALGSGGTVDFLRVYELMRDCGYRGPFVIRFDHARDDSAVDAFFSNLATSVSHLEDCGFFD